MHRVLIDECINPRLAAHLRARLPDHYEHNVEKLSFAVVVLETANNQMPSYERLFEDLIRQIQSAAPGQVVRVSDPER